MSFRWVPNQSLELRVDQHVTLVAELKIQIPEQWSLHWSQIARYVGTRRELCRRPVPNDETTPWHVIQPYYPVVSHRRTAYAVRRSLPSNPIGKYPKHPEQIRRTSCVCIQPPEPRNADESSSACRPRLHPENFQTPVSPFGIATASRAHPKRLTDPYRRPEMEDRWERASTNGKSGSRRASWHPSRESPPLDDNHAMGLPETRGKYVPENSLPIAAGLMAFPERTLPRGPPDRRELNKGKDEKLGRYCPITVSNTPYLEVSTPASTRGK
ncbi:hypothetical protein BDV59DRAFT_40419 [Aspergillus ambiguus]|uniref:uncharacterized protein n=1 Tax=Aspergillus ambiguus TaxID=176160 RepID=UPI003CCCF85D